MAQKPMLRGEVGARLLVALAMSYCFHRFHFRCSSLRPPSCRAGREPLSPGRGDRRCDPSHLCRRRGPRPSPPSPFPLLLPPSRRTGRQPQAPGRAVAPGRGRPCRRRCHCRHAAMVPSYHPRRPVVSSPPLARAPRAAPRPPPPLRLRRPPRWSFSWSKTSFLLCPLKPVFCQVFDPSH